MHSVMKSSEQRNSSVHFGWDGLVKSESLKVGQNSLGDWTEKNPRTAGEMTAVRFCLQFSFDDTPTCHSQNVQITSENVCMASAFTIRAQRWETFVSCRPRASNLLHGSPKLWWEGGTSVTSRNPVYWPLWPGVWNVFISSRYPPAGGVTANSREIFRSLMSLHERTRLH